MMNEKENLECLFVDFLNTILARKEESDAELKKVQTILKKAETLLTLK